MARDLSEEKLKDARTDRRRYKDRTYAISDIRMRDEEHRNTLESLGNKESSLDGLDPSVFVADEAAEYTTRALQKLTTATVKRRSAFGILITTPGQAYGTIWEDMRREGVETLEEQSSSGDGTFYYLAGIDESDDPADTQNWIKANPSLGVTVIKEDLKQRFESESAKGPRYVQDFVRYNLARFSGDVCAWLPAEDWDACKGTVDDEELIGGRAWFGVDLSKTRDLTAVVGIIEHPFDGSLHVRAFFFYPDQQARERERELHMPILKWAQEGYIHLNPGRTIDYSQVHDTIRKLHETYDEPLFYHDPFCCGWGEQVLASEGINVWGLQQTIVQLSPGTLHIEELVASVKIHHDGNPVLARCIANARAYIDTNQNVRLNKAKSDGLIDGAMALCMAGRAHLESVGMSDSCPVV
jgi:phage terminase large subunit-like protein